MSTIHTVVEIIGWWFVAGITAGLLVWLALLCFGDPPDEPFTDDHTE